ncbi:MAG: hypothetical protein GY719_40185 [bacterium]|nr:hypothetical protein [bacterium]
MNASIEPWPRHVLDSSSKHCDDIEPCSASGFAHVEHLTPLEAAIENLAAEKANFYGTLKAKRDALASFDRVYVQGNRVLEGYYRLTGNDLWADTLRLTARKPTSSEEEPAPSEDDAPAVETVEVTSEPGPEVEPAA